MALPLACQMTGDTLIQTNGQVAVAFAGRLDMGWLCFAAIAAGQSR